MKIATFTSSRADSGILMPLLLELEARLEVNPVIFVSGTHLFQSFGSTYEAEFAGLSRSEKVLIPLPAIEETFESQADAMGYALTQFARKIRDYSPDLAIVLGDRTEALVFSIACTMAGVPLAHLHGGELTFGALDELHRHAITKLSSIHFVSTEENARRVIQMGENPSHVFSFGSPRADTLKNFVPLPLSSCAAELGLKYLPTRFALFAVHNAKFDNPSTELIAREALRALGSEGYYVVITGTNSDEGFELIREAQDEFMTMYPESATYLESAGSVLYLSLLANCKVAVGNSSSLALEAPFLGTPTVILGRRQLGRVPESACISGGHEEIANAIRLAERQPKIDSTSHDSLRVSKQIVDALLSFEGMSPEKRFQTIEY